MTDTFPRSSTPAAGTAADSGAGSQARTIADSEATTAFREHIARVNPNAEDRAVAPLASASTGCWMPAPSSRSAATPAPVLDREPGPRASSPGSVR